MSNQLMMAEHLSMLESFESELNATAVAETVAEIPQSVGSIASPEEQGELIELTSGITNATNGVVALESLVRRFKDIGSYTQEHLDNYYASMEAVIIAGNFQIAPKVLVPSFESDKSPFEYSCEADEAAQGVIAKVWAWIKAKAKALVGLLKRIFARITGRYKKTKEKIKETVTKVKAGEEGKDKISIDKVHAHYLVDGSGNPLPFRTVVGKLLAGRPSAVWDLIPSMCKAVTDADPKEMSRIAKSGSYKYLAGGVIDFTPGKGENPAVGFTAVLSVPGVAKEGILFEPLPVAQFVEGLNKVSIRLADLERDNESMMQDLLTLSDLVEPRKSWTPEEGELFQRSFTNLNMAAQKLLPDLVAFEVLTADALVAYAIAGS